MTAALAALALALVSSTGAARAPACTPPGASAPEAGARPCDPAVRARTLELLGAIDRPIRPETWRALGPDAEPVLAEVAASDALPTRRALALEGLAAIGGARAEKLHRSLAADTHEPRAVRRAAIRGLGRLVPREKLDATLRPLLERDPDRGVRAGAAEVLSRRSPASSCAAIRAQARREGTAGSGLFARALAACER
ncbi:MULTISPECIES: HEAT repeat domain-containing protein [Anaeromyxobacter]|uniref:HEAT repeat domain-containing protein n=1 Tax=Anaeromyxobacter TaxID=161492 RepID=UPI001F5AA1D0|nr:MULTISPECIES: HEAT repeat domain-containing protein [unclassified Anaeromyxobacter]